MCTSVRGLNVDAVNRLRFPLGDWLLPVVLAALMTLETWRDADLGRHLAPSLVTGLAMCVALAWRRQAPMGTLAVVAAAFAAYPFIDPEPSESLVHAVAFLVAAYAVAAHLPLRPALLGLLAVVVGGLVRSWQMGIYDTGSVIVNSLWGLVAWGVGRGIHSRERRATMAQLAATESDELREVSEREAIYAERQRIARELHDVVAHAVTVIVVQARGARRLLEADPAAARKAIDAIEEMGSDAIDELRRMLALLEDPDDGEQVRSGPAELRALVDRVSAAGLPVTLNVDGSPSHRAASVDVSAYRVVQEALTNALRHGGGPATVTVGYAPDAIEVHVESAIGSKNFTGTGRGLAGLRERVRLTGGSLDVGTGDDSRFHVRAALPVGSQMA